MNLLASPIETEHNVDGSFPQGFLFGSIKNVGNQTALVNGVDFPPGESKAYPFVGKGYEEIPFVTNGTVLRVMIIV